MTLKLIWLHLLWMHSEAQLHHSMLLLASFLPKCRAQELGAWLCTHDQIELTSFREDQAFPGRGVSPKGSCSIGSCNNNT